MGEASGALKQRGFTVRCEASVIERTKQNAINAVEMMINFTILPNL